MGREEPGGLRPLSGIEKVRRQDAVGCTDPARLCENGGIKRLWHRKALERNPGDTAIVRDKCAMRTRATRTYPIGRTRECHHCALRRSNSTPTFSAIGRPIYRSVAESRMRAF